MQDAANASTFSVAALIYGIVALATLAVVVFMMVRMLVWVIGALFGPSLVHPSAAVRLISFALALAISPPFIGNLVAYSAGLIGNIFFFAPDGISNGIRNVQSICLEDDNQCLWETATSYARFLRDLVGQILPQLRNGGYLLESAIFVALAWILIGQFIVLVLGLDKMSPAAAKVRATLLGLSKAAVKNLTLATILVLASYLSFASIAALPYLEREDLPQDVQPDRLEKLLNDTAQPITKFIDTNDPDGASENPFDNLKQIGTTGSTGPTKVDFAASKQQADAQNHELIKQLAGLRERIKENLATLQMTASSTYTTASLKRAGARVTIDHFRAIHTWYLGQLTTLRNNLNDCTQALFAFQRATSIALTGSDSGQGGSAPTSFAPPPPPTPPPAASDDDASSQRSPEPYVPGYAAPYVPFTGAGYFVPPSRPGSEYIDAREACTFRYSQEEPPSRGSLNNYTGFFAPAISWLLSSESQPIVLIVGMIGFGLLGAACSTFVREVSQRPAKAPGSDGALVEDLAGVVIRGVSAAVVVFLAVFGGLAVFASDSQPNPNPYVVLFTCLVGAVFSEIVWNWAQDKLKGELNSHKAKEPQTTDPKAPTPADPSQPAEATKI
jgi:hypothetical protein